MDLAYPENWRAEDTKVLQILASVLADNDRADNAILILEYLRRREPQNVELLRALAGAYLLVQRFAESLACAETALQYSQSDDRLQQLLLVKSHACWGLNRHAEAQRAMADYIQKRAGT